MIRFFTTLFLLLTSLAALPQELPPHDLSQLTIVGGKTPVETALSIGRQFLGKPYVSHTLDTTPTEQLIINVREFDCTTYLETVLALSLAWHEMPDKGAGPQLEQAFRTYLTKFRYRNGKIDGYASRLHYFSDWLRDNERKGLLTDVTGELTGSISVAKPVSYMTTATYKYPQLSDPATLKQMQLAEAALNQQAFAFIPRKNIRLAESQLQEGDIIMLTAARPGLDMKHVGLAVRQPNGRIHLMHASSEQGEVVVTPYPLSDYVLWHKNLSGIRVARLRGSGVFAAVK
ncbi:N-acetylmuramoyl-L-alanine amidase-like domain-containing protein [Spirosoma utsteinense]|uniref:DUF1460 domain-containing protein n=1 Tax=Spirosoma utsteinense TaxID=2585773 RepID=A0ABR6WAX7_9BACT|nr:N-acetylmuramoyl-L-alanine amidase-like domain-containing protein [Spirosoma utsteinense]MBC3787370.1 hypothetical protein [Spirosoma utsteinense]MBC3793076.1 hypothetical protein [Spirosoma utsteinense]